MITNRKFTAALVLTAGTFAAVKLMALVNTLSTLVG